jgi:hypothetical protein
MLRDIVEHFTLYAPKVGCGWICDYYSLMAVLRFSRSLNCPRFTPAEDRCGSASMQRRSTQPTSGSATARAEQQKADPPPYVPGIEAAGIVDEVGSGVPDRLKVGDAVMAIVVPKGSHGAYREQIVLDARSVVPAPTGKTILRPAACR